MDTKPNIVGAFVALSLGHDWSKDNGLAADEIQLLFEVVSVAGFEPREVVLGKLRGNYIEQDGSPTGETYPINDTCPYRVVNQEGGDHYRATKWLDGALKLARSGTNRDQLATSIQKEIERSVPLEPVQLTPEGDFLLELPPEHGCFVDHARDWSQFKMSAGVHQYCRGWVDRTRVTKAHDVLVCRRCHLRVLFPTAVNTYGELRHYFTSKAVQVPA